MEAATATFVALAVDATRTQSLATPLITHESRRRATTPPWWRRAQMRRLFAVDDTYATTVLTPLRRSEFAALSTTSRRRSYCVWISRSAIPRPDSVIVFATSDVPVISRGNA